jgi:hypothetical protein
MNKDNAKQFLPLVQALADGKIIQHNNNGEWKDMYGDSVAFGNEIEHYRIKPEPREWECVLSGASEYLLDAKSVSTGGRKIIRVREILD